MSDVVSLRTLVVKIPGLMLSVAAGRAHFWADFADIFYFQLPLQGPLEGNTPLRAVHGFFDSLLTMRQPRSLNRDSRGMKALVVGFGLSGAFGFTVAVRRIVVRI